jgi:uncharacterized membrane protein
MSSLKIVMKWLLGLVFVLGGLNHFWKVDFYVRIMPPYLPWHKELVYLSGLCEVALGVLLLIPKHTAFAAWGLIALLVAVFPANVHMALNPSLYPEYPAYLLWLRLPLQAVFIAWTYWFTQRPA